MDTREYNQIITWTSPEEAERLDLVITERLESYSRSKISEAIKASALLLNGKKAKASQKVNKGDKISLDLSFFHIPPLEPEDMKLEIIYEDEELLAINKPAHIISHPSPRRRTGSLVNGLLALNRPLGQVRGPEMAGIVHRLDAETTGLLLVAKTDRMQEALMESFKSRQVKKTYLAILEGNFDEQNFNIENNLGRDPENSSRQAVLTEGRYAHSVFSTIKSGQEASFVRVNIFTGRTHQIRVHAKYISHPIVGDKLYGYRKQRHRTDHQMLHAGCLEFIYPFSGENIILKARADAEFLRMLKLYSLLPENIEEISSYLPFA